MCNGHIMEKTRVVELICLLTRPFVKIVRRDSYDLSETSRSRLLCYQKSVSGSLVCFLGRKENAHQLLFLCGILVGRSEALPS